MYFIYTDGAKKMYTYFKKGKNLRSSNNKCTSTIHLINAIF